MLVAVLQRRTTVALGHFHLPREMTGRALRSATTIGYYQVVRNCLLDHK